MSKDGYHTFSPLQHLFNNMKIETTLKVLKVILIINIMLFVFVLGFGYGKGYHDFSILTTKETSQCEFKSVREASLCLLEEQKTFYKYNISTIGLSLTEEELKITGGVCSHYSDWYVGRARSLGLFGKRIDFYSDNLIGHSIAILYDSNINEYCIMDQVNLIGCGELANGVGDIDVTR